MGPETQLELAMLRARLGRAADLLAPARADEISPELALWLLIERDGQSPELVRELVRVALHLPAWEGRRVPRPGRQSPR